MTTLRDAINITKNYITRNVKSLAFGSMITILVGGGCYYIGRKVCKAGTPNLLYNTELKKLFKKKKD